MGRDHPPGGTDPRHPYACCPNRSPNRTGSTTSTSDDAIDSAASSTSANTLPELHGRGFGTYLRRASPADERQLADAGPREVVWARRYLGLYVPGTAVALYYLTMFVLPSMPHLVGLRVAPIRADGLHTLAAWEGLAALAVAVVPSSLALLGAACGGWRILSTAVRRRSGTSGAQAV